MQLRGRHLLLAVMVALVFHGGAAIWAFWKPLTSGAFGAGVGGLTVALGTAGGMTGVAQPLQPAEADEAIVDEATAEDIDVPEASEIETPEAEVTDAIEAEAPEPVEAVEVTPDVPVEEVTSETVEPSELAEVSPIEPVEQAQTVPVLAEPIETAEPLESTVVEPLTPAVPSRLELQIPEPVQELAAVTPTEPVTQETIEIEQVDDPVEAVEESAVPKPPAKPKPPKKFTEKKKPKVETVKQRPKEVETKQAEKTPTKEPVREAKATEAGQSPAASETTGSGNEGKSGGQENTGQANAASSGGNPGARRDYMAKLAAILARHKRYPRRAQSRRQEGTGQLYFVVDSGGRIVKSSLRRSSGHRLLDKEILDILGRVGRLPPIPDDLGVANLEIVVPIQFSLR